MRTENSVLSWVMGALKLMGNFMRQSFFGSIFDHHRAMTAVQEAEPIDHNPITIYLNIPWYMKFDSGSRPFYAVCFEQRLTFCKSLPLELFLICSHHLI